MWNNGYNPMFWGGFGSIFMIIIWVLIIAGIVYLVKWSLNQSGNSSAPRGNNALKILKERYAKGEINKQEFEEKKKELA